MTFAQQIGLVGYVAAIQHIKAIGTNTCTDDKPVPPAAARKLRLLPTPDAPTRLTTS